MAKFVGVALASAAATYAFMRWYSPQAQTLHPSPVPVLDEELRDQFLKSPDKQFTLILKVGPESEWSWDQVKTNISTMKSTTIVSEMRRYLALEVKTTGSIALTMSDLPFIREIREPIHYAVAG